MSKVQQAPIMSLCPTQLTIGLIEVEAKRKHLCALSAKEQGEFLESHPMPVVIGPGKKLYITDHHHLARAALEAGIETGFFLIEADMAQLELNAFWRAMGEKHWAHPIDEQGHRQPFAAIPKHLEELRDDVYRSLAGFVRTAGGYLKTPTAYAEFLWADFFRHRIVVGPTHEDFKSAVAQALILATSAVAHDLPGYRGAV